MPKRTVSRLLYAYRLLTYGLIGLKFQVFFGGGDFQKTQSCKIVSGSWKSEK